MSLPQQQQQFTGRTQQLEKMRSVLQQLQAQPQPQPPPPQATATAAAGSGSSSDGEQEAAAAVPAVSVLLWQGSRGCGKTRLLERFYDEVATTTTATTAAQQQEANAEEGRGIVIAGRGSFPDPEFIRGRDGGDDALSSLLRAVDGLLLAYANSSAAAGAVSVVDQLSPYDLSLLLPFFPQLREQISSDPTNLRVQQLLAAVSTGDSSTAEQGGGGGDATVKRLTVALCRLLTCIGASPAREAEDNDNDDNSNKRSDTTTTVVVWCLDDLHHAPPPALAVLERILSHLANQAHTTRAHARQTTRWLIIATCDELDLTSTKTSQTPLGPFLLKCKATRVDLRIREVPPLSVKNVSHQLAAWLGMTKHGYCDLGTLALLRPLARVVHRQTQGQAMAVLWHVRLLQDLRLLPKQAGKTTTKRVRVKEEGPGPGPGNDTVEEQTEAFCIDWDLAAIEKLPIVGGASPPNDSSKSDGNTDTATDATARDAAAAAAAVSPTVLLDKIIVLRWRAMPPKGQALLQIAACYHGSVFGCEALYGLLRKTEPKSNISNKTSILPQFKSPKEVMELLSYATQLGYLTLQRGLFSFAHDGIRRVLYRASPPARLHLELGRRCYDNYRCHDQSNGNGNGAGTVVQGSVATATTAKDFSLLWGAVQQWNRAASQLTDQERGEWARLSHFVALRDMEHNHWFAASHAAQRALVAVGTKPRIGTTPSGGSSADTEAKGEGEPIRVGDAHQDDLLEWSTTSAKADYACGKLNAARMTGKLVLQQCAARQRDRPAASPGLFLPQHPNSPKYKYDVYQTQISSLLQQHRHKDALGLVLTVLRELGEDLPILGKNTTAYLVDRIIPETQAMLINFDFDDISGDSRRRRGSNRRLGGGTTASLDPSENSILKDRMEFYERLVDISQLHNPGYQALALLRTLQITVEYGRCFPMSGLALVFWGFVLGLKGLYTEARHFANMGMALTATSNSQDPVYTARCRTMFSEIPMFSSQLVDLKDLQRADDVLCWHGYLEAACLGRITTFWTHFGNEDTLDPLRVDDMQIFLQLLHDYGQEHLVCLYAPLVRLANRLTETDAGDDFEEKRRLERLVKKAQCEPSSTSPTTMTPAMIEDCIQSTAICRLVGAYLFDNLTEAGEMLDLVMSFESQSQQYHNNRFSTSSLSSSPVQLFMQGMSVWSLAEVAQTQSSVEDSIKQTMKLYKQGEAIVRKLEEWVQRGGEAALSLGYRHMLLLLRAQEQCSRPSSIDLSRIANAFDSGISASSGAGSNKGKKKVEAAPFFSALGCERAAVFFKTQGEVKTAATYYRRAMMTYQRWGAEAKVKDIDGKHQALLWLMDNESRSSLMSEGS